MTRVKKVSKTNFLGQLLPITILIRVIAPLFVFTFPLFSTLTTWLLDLIDSPFYRQSGISRINYQLMDKTLDLYWYSISLVYAFFNLEFFGLLVFLYSVRFIGHMFFYKTKNEKYLILMPNFYEFVFWLLLFVQFFPNYNYLIGENYFAKVMTTLFTLKLIQEVMIHKLDKYYIRLFPEWIRSPE